MSLLDPGLIPALNDCTIIVELHDYEFSGDHIISGAIRRRFSGRNIQSVWSHPRTYEEVGPLLFRERPEDDIAKLLIDSVEENRPCDMEWFLIQ